MGYVLLGNPQCGKSSLIRHIAKIYKHNTLMKNDLDQELGKRDVKNNFNEYISDRVDPLFLDDFEANFFKIMKILLK